MVVQDLLAHEGTDDEHLVPLFLYQGHFQRHGHEVYYVNMEMAFMHLDGKGHILGF